MNTELPAAQGSRAICVSIGIIAWNEEKALVPMLESLFTQSLFAELGRRNLRCEIVCVANGCTDRTREVASEFFSEQKQTHPYSDCFSCRSVEIAERGKINAWNSFVHSLSAREARFLFLADADIVIHQSETLWNMVRLLERNREAHVVVDRASKDIEFKSRKSVRQSLSLAMSALTRGAPAQLCGQLYGIRAEVARNIYLPRDLAACDDGLIKTLVCTDLLAHPVWPVRIQTARNAGHTFEAYLSLRGVLKNQKRQVIGQTMVHLLVDDYLPKLSCIERQRLAETLREKERAEPRWLKRLVTEHVQNVKFFWRLYPGLVDAPVCASRTVWFSEACPLSSDRFCRILRFAVGGVPGA